MRIRSPFEQGKANVDFVNAEIIRPRQAVDSVRATLERASEI